MNTTSRARLYGMRRKPRMEIACDGAALVPDVVTVDVLARLQLRARRHGGELRVVGASEELRALLALVGLAEALGVEAGRQAEAREERGGVEEEGQLGDPAVADLDDL